MRTIFKIGATELRTLFYSPIAWFLIIIFMVQCSVTYIDMLDSIARSQEEGFRAQFSLINDLFYGRNGVMGGVMRNLYLYLPLLTMGLISREVSSGTIKLLYSSPINLRDIVLGKFLCMMILSAILVFVVAIFMILSVFTVQSPDLGVFLGSLFGLYLLLCAYSAIGLFMSCLSNYQIVTAVCTFVTIGILYSVGGLWEGVPFVRDITYFLSVAGRTDKLMRGLITSKDLIYFVLIVFMFLSLSILKLKGGMESVSSWIKFRRYSLVVIMTFGIGYISSIPQIILYLDLTRNQSNTLSKTTQKIISELGDEPLEITGYANLFSSYFEDGDPKSYNKNIRLWEPYTRFKHNIQLKSIMYYDTLNQGGGFMAGYPGKSLAKVAEKLAETRNLNLKSIVTPLEARKLVDLSSESGWYTMQLKYKGRKTFLRVYQDNEHWPSETEVSAALKRLLHEDMPKIGFVTGNLERNINKIGDREYKALANLKTFRNSLLNQGFDVDTVLLDGQPVSEKLSVLVLADPKVDLNTSVMSSLKQYIDRGGNLLIAGEPGKQSVLNPILSQLGVSLMPGAIVQQSRELAPELATPFLTANAAKLYKPLEHGHHDSAVVSMPFATGISSKAEGIFKIEPLLESNPKRSWLKKNKFVTDSATVKFEPEFGDLREKFPLAVSLTRMVGSRQQRIVVLGDADFMSNAEHRRFNMRTANFVFSTGLFSWLSYNRFPIVSAREAAIDTKVFVNKEQVKVLRLVFVWALPGILLVLGSLLLIRRKRK